MDKLWLIPLASIVSLTIVLCVAMFLGKNGIILALGCAGISGLGGYEIKQLLGKFKKG